MDKLRVYDIDGMVHDYTNIHQIIDMGEVVLIIYTDVENEKLKCVGHAKIDIESMGLTI